MKLTNKETIANLNHIYGIVSPDIQRSLDLAIKALRIVDIIEACFKRDSNLMMDYDDWADVKEEAENTNSAK